ncbi:lactococcin 972 family bacteriocin [Xylocopilactobacillus apicola]|uniref:Lactococcin 972 family bacteriocin n=1 Tax=Xylocopilactobacillus apicola TaxID=2932184 RepID=A0AAU9DNX0_9LACO|nr:lactococcin 972 family bacteriocin [Xylocopilactobacillus apicola]BDR58797.1 hypothetical protein XA3_12380 [Xylocopilactobacillus apicola]
MTLNKVKKALLTAVALGAVIGPVTTVAAYQVEERPTYASVWWYGHNDKEGAYSAYYHQSQHHSATVRSRWFKEKYKKGFASPAQMAYANIWTLWGEPAAFWYDYY